MFISIYFDSFIQLRWGGWVGQPPSTQEEDEWKSTKSGKGTRTSSLQPEAFWIGETNLHGEKGGKHQGLRVK